MHSSNERGKENVDKEKDWLDSIYKRGAGNGIHGCTPGYRSPRKRLGWLEYLPVTLLTVVFDLVLEMDGTPSRRLLLNKLVSRKWSQLGIVPAGFFFYYERKSVVRSYTSYNFMEANIIWNKKKIKDTCNRRNVIMKILNEINTIPRNDELLSF